MVTHDRIRLTGLLRKSPAHAGLFYSPEEFSGHHASRRELIRRSSTNRRSRTMSLTRVQQHRHLARRIRHRRRSEPGRTVRRRRRQAARMDVRHPVVERNGRPARRHRRHRRCLRAAVRSGIGAEIMGAGKFGWRGWHEPAEGRVGSRPVVPRTGRRARPSLRPPIEMERHDVPLHRRFACRSARAAREAAGGQDVRSAAIRDDRRDPCRRARRPHAHGGGTDPASRGDAGERRPGDDYDRRGDRLPADSRM